MTEMNKLPISDESGLPESSVKNTQIAFQGRIWNVVAKTFDFQGEELTREYIQHPGAVAVLAINKKMKFYLSSSIALQ